MWDTAVSTLRMAPRGRRPTWPAAEDLWTVSRGVQVQQPVDSDKNCGVCVLLSSVGIPLRVQRPGNNLSTVDRRWVAAMVLKRDMGPIMRLPSPEELPAAAPSALLAPRAPMVVADPGRQTGLPDARLQHALLCLAAAPGWLSLPMLVSLQHIGAALQRQRPHSPKP